MTIHNFNLKSYPVDKWIGSDPLLYLILAMIALFSYGYEIFNFTLTIDEELYAGENIVNFWLSQARWGMAFLHFFVMPYHVVAVVPVFLGVAGITIGLLAIIRTIFPIDRTGGGIIAGVGLTIPIFLFILVFSINAYGIGIAILAIAFGNRLVFNKNIKSIILAVFLGGFAIGVYQTFIFIITILVLFQIWRFSIDESKQSIVNYIIYPAMYFLGSIFIYLGIDFIVRNSLQLELSYVQNKVDILGFINNPIEKLYLSSIFVLDIIRFSPEWFGIESVWLKIILFISFLIIFINAIFLRTRTTIGLAINSILVVLIIVGSNAIYPSTTAPIRSLMHISVGVTFIVASAYILSGQYIRVLIIILCGLGIIGNSSINNHLSASAARTEFYDRVLAQTIITEVKKLGLRNKQNTVYRLEVIGVHSWPTTAIQSKTSVIGVSFFERSNGYPNRAAAYLKLTGLKVVPLQIEKRVDIYEKAQEMPSWPQDGWLSVNKDIIILKFGDYTPAQARVLCSFGVKKLCPVMQPAQ
jgi:hypothetical protein